MRAFHLFASRTAATLFCVVAIVVAAAQSEAQEAVANGGEWATLGGDEIAVLHHPEDIRYAERVLAIYDRRGPEIAESMGLPTLSPLRVLIASTDEEFAVLTHHGAPDWGVGCALPARGLVVLKSPRIVSYPLQMESVVEHEFAHMAAGRVLRGIDVPRWFDEGLAQAVAGEWRLAQSGAIAQAAASGRLPPLSALERSFPSDSNAAAMAYAMSFQAVRLLSELSGARHPGELVSSIREAGDFNEAVEALTGLGPSEFEREYSKFLSRRFTWGTLLNDGRLLFALIAALFVVAVLVRLRRRRDRMHAWEREENVEGRGPAEPKAPGDSRWN